MRKYIVEYSQSQEAFHIQPLQAAITANRRRYERCPQRMFDWVPVFVGSRRACEMAIRELEKRAKVEEVKQQLWMH